MTKEFFREAAAEIIRRLPWSGMEFYLYINGNYGFRQRDSFAIDEDKICVKLPLAHDYWDIMTALKDGREVGFATACEMLEDGYDDPEVAEFLTDEILYEIKEQLRSGKQHYKGGRNGPGIPPGPLYGQYHKRNCQ